MRVAWTGLVAVAAASVPAAAAATPMPTRVTGRALAGVCDADRGACLGYVVGAVDAFVATQVTRGGPVPFCLPQGVTNQQLAETAMAALRARPDLADNNAATIVVVALTAAYRCAPPPRPPQPPGR
jgi:hypothetical protein